jgi:hypothetical protein
LRAEQRVHQPANVDEVEKGYRADVSSAGQGGPAGGREEAHHTPAPVACGLEDMQTHQPAEGCEQYGALHDQDEKLEGRVEVVVLGVGHDEEPFHHGQRAYQQGRPRAPAGEL